MSNIIQIAAQGNSQANATVLPLFESLCIEVAPVVPGSGIILPYSQSVSDILIYNTGANTLNIYPPIGGSINNNSINSPFTLASNSKAILYSVKSTANSVSYVSITGP